MAQNGIVTTYDDAGFPTASLFSGSISAAGTVVLKGGPGRLVMVTVTASSTGAITFYDNATAGSGLVLLAVPASAAVGTVYSVNLPAKNGITYTAAASPSTVTVGWS
jgi:hypothetical protein